MLINYSSPEIISQQAEIITNAMKEPFTFTVNTPDFKLLASVLDGCIIPRDFKYKVTLKIRTFTADELEKLFSFKYPSSLEALKLNQLDQRLVRSNNSVIIEISPEDPYENIRMCEVNRGIDNVLNPKAPANVGCPLFTDITDIDLTIGKKKRIIKVTITVINVKNL